MHPSGNKYGIAVKHNDNMVVIPFVLSSKKKIAELDKCGLGAYQGNQLIRKLFVTMPWLENANVEDYIDIVNKFKAEFECYNHCLAGISGVTEDTEKLKWRNMYDTF